MKVRFLRASYFVWIIGPLAAYASYQAFGLPHVIWSYSFRGGERGATIGGEPEATDFASRWYTRCTFVGPYGAFTTHPTDGACPWFAFRKSSDVSDASDAKAGGAQ